MIAFSCSGDRLRSGSWKIVLKLEFWNESSRELVIASRHCRMVNKIVTRPDAGFDRYSVEFVESVSVFGSKLVQSTILHELPAP